MTALRGLRLDEVAYAVVDVETTGLRPGVDHIVEIAIVRMDPGQPPAVALDTLVDPRRPVTGTDVHGLTTEDVAGAPTIDELAGEIARACAGRVVVGHNVSFDRHFLAAELAPYGLSFDVPSVDTSYLRPLLADGARKGLAEMCQEYGIQTTPQHMALADAIDTSKLLQVLLARARRVGIERIDDLARGATYQFQTSLLRPPLTPDTAERLPSSANRRSRRRTHDDVPLRTYFSALCLVLADATVTQDELTYLAALRAHLSLTDDDVFAMHAQAFTGALIAGVADNKIRPEERDYLRNLANCLRMLGWCPGD